MVLGAAEIVRWLETAGKKIAAGDIVPRPFLERIEQRVERLTRKQCSREDLKKIVQVQEIASGLLSPSLPRLSFQTNTSLPQEPLFPTFRSGWVSWLAQGLLFQGMISNKLTLLLSPPPSNKSTKAIVAPRVTQSTEGFLIPTQTKHFLPPLSASAKATLSSPLSSKSTEKQPKATPATTSLFQPVYDFFNWIRGVPALRNRNRLVNDCPDLHRNQLDFMEEEALKLDSSWKSGGVDFSSAQEWLRFREDDRRSKLLYVVAKYDPSRGLFPGNQSQLLLPLSKAYDIKYVVVRKFGENCNEIDPASQTGKVAHLIIDGHGDQKHIYLDFHTGFFTLNNWDLISRKSSFSECFSRIAPEGKILLLSCNAGKSQNGDPYNNIASTIAIKTMRTVIASTDLVYGSRVSVSSTQELNLDHDNYNPFYFWGNYPVVTAYGPMNAHFRSFYPQYPGCDDVSENQLHPQERLVLKSVQGELVRRGFLWESSSLRDVQDYFRFCNADPKRKLLYLHAPFEFSKRPQPSHISSFLVQLADKFDLRFKLVQEEREICDEVRQAVKTQNLAAVLIHSPGNPDKLSLPENPLSRWRKAYETIFGGSETFPDCLAEIPSSAYIILVGGSTGADPSEEFTENLATQIARKVQRTVIAPTSLTDASKLTLRSHDPIEIYHPSIGHLFDSDTNIFRRFDP